MRTKARPERGQSMILVAVAMVALVAFTALAIDAAQAYYQRRQMQNAADAGSLAGAYQTCLEGSAQEKTQSAEAKARQFARLNLARDPIGVAVDLPNRTVGVTTHITFGTYFAGVIGFPELNAGAFALAKAECSSGEYVIWAHSDHCEMTIDWSGSNMDVTGYVHTNHDLKMGGSNNTIKGTTEWVSSTDISGSDNDLSLEKVPYDPVWPVWFDIAAFRPGGAAAIAAGPDYHHVNGLFEAKKEGSPYYGLYYVTGDIKLTDSDLWGTATFVAEGRIYVSGSDHDFEPFYSGLFLFSNMRHGDSDKRCSEDVLEISGSNSEYNGIVFAPRGRIQYAGSNHTVIKGAIIGDTIRLNGSNSGIHGGTPAAGPPTVKLIE